MSSLRLDKLLPWLVLAAGLAATFFLQQAAFNVARQIQQDNFAFQSREITLRIEQRLTAYEQMLRGVKGLYNASKSVERDEFHDYVASLRLEAHYPGIQGVGFSLIVPPREKAGHIEAIRKEGFPDYTLHPEGERDLYTSIIYLEPFSGRNLLAFGYDMYSEAVRRAAMEQARDLDKAAISGKVMLAQEAGQNVQAGFLMYLPVYRNGSPHETLAERRANILGWVYAPFRMDDLMRGILGEQVNKVDLHISNGENVLSETLLYDNDNHLSLHRSETSLYHSTQRIKVIDHTWTIEQRSLPAFEANIDTGRVSVIRLAGILGSGLLSLLVWQLASGRTRALKLAQGMTRELRESESRLASTLTSAELGAWDWNIRTGHVVFNERWAELRGYRLEEVEASIRSWEIGVCPEDFPLVQKKLAEHFEGNSAIFDAEYRARTKSGELIWIMDRGTVIERDTEGKPLRMVGIEENITERKGAEAELRIAATAFESQDGMVITDARGVILRVNHAFTEITGYTAEEAVGQTSRLLKSGRHDAAFYAAMWESILRTGAWRGEIWNRRKNGEVYPEQLTITAVKSDTGEITHHVATMHDITRRKQAEEQIRTLAFYDTLTQLPNRRLLNDRLGKAMAASKRSGHYGALMFLDLDNFKPLNDTYGHGVGDLLLIEVAHRLTGCVREVDTVARFGGDEFVVMLGELDADKAESTAQAGIVAEKIRSTLAEPYLLKIQQEGKAETTVEHHCTSSVGIVLFINHEVSAEDILKWADTAMYQAKERGRNQVHFFDSKS